MVNLPGYFGSGVALKPQWILTANHIVEKTKTRKYLNIYHPASNQEFDVVNIIPDPDHDLALLQLDRPLDIEQIRLATTPVKGARVIMPNVRELTYQTPLPLNPGWQAHDGRQNIVNGEYKKQPEPLPHN